MNDEPKKRGRPAAKPDLERFLEAIVDGLFDEDLARIEGVCKSRHDILRQKVLDQVHEVFGPDATVTISRGASPEPKHNRFIDRARQAEAAPPEPPELSDDEPDDEPITDRLADATLEAINSGEQVPLEMRGAIIGGLSVADIGD
jgi:hypothetical protein